METKVGGKKKGRKNIKKSVKKSIFKSISSTEKLNMFWISYYPGNIENELITEEKTYIF